MTTPPRPARAGRGLDARTGEITRLAAILATHADGDPDILQRYIKLLPDAVAALERLGCDLAGRPVAPTRGWSTGWSEPLADEEIRHLLYLLVQFGGWHRVKECGISHCGRPFLDASNANNRRARSRHIRGAAKRSQWSVSSCT